METIKGSLLVAALCMLGATALDWNAVHVTWGVVSGYTSLPTTKADVLASDFYFMSRDEDLDLDFYSQKWDPRLSFGYDTNGNIAAIRVGYIKSDIGVRSVQNNLTFPTNLFENNVMYDNGTFWETDVWYNTVLFASPDVLRAGGRQYTNRVADDIYIKLNGEWTVMPREEEEATEMNFVKQRCFIGLGKNYFYGLNKEAKCEDLQGVSLQYESKELIGVGLTPFGSFTNADGISWFESVPDLSSKIITPTAPECLNDWMNEYGVASVHIFLKKHPRLTVCVWPWN